MIYLPYILHTCIYILTAVRTLATSMHTYIHSYTWISNSNIYTYLTYIHYKMIAGPREKRSESATRSWRLPGCFALSGPCWPYRWTPYTCTCMYVYMYVCMYVNYIYILCIFLPHLNYFSRKYLLMYVCIGCM